MRPTMNTNATADWTLLIIDAQNDFRDTARSALPVPGATADLRRLARLIRTCPERVRDILLTFDSQPQVAIERVTFWERGDGSPVAPFTQFSRHAVLTGQFRPRNPLWLETVLAYLEALEARDRIHTVWPVHGVIGTWGHM